MAYRLGFTDKAKEDIDFYKKSGNKPILKKLLVLFRRIDLEHPFAGTGKPEPLKHNLSGMWSRRINKRHRLIYEVEEDTVVILLAKGHYG